MPKFDKWKLLSDKIQDEQWSTHKIKALWKKDPKFGKWCHHYQLENVH